MALPMPSYGHSYIYPRFHYFFNIKILAILKQSQKLHKFMWFCLARYSLSGIKTLKTIIFIKGKPDYPVLSDNMDFQRCRISTQRSIPHSVPPTHIRRNVPSVREPMERKPLQKPNQCTKSYSGIKKRLTGRMPTSLTKAEIKGSNSAPEPFIRFTICPIPNVTLETMNADSINCLLLIQVQHM